MHTLLHTCENRPAVSVIVCHRISLCLSQLALPQLAIAFNPHHHRHDHHTE